MTAGGPVTASDGAQDGAQERLQRDYRPAFLRYLSRRDEQARHSGYLLGRAAVAQGRGVLDVVAAHHVTLLEVLPDVRAPAEVLTTSTAASEFLTEVLSAFSMTTHAFASLRQQLQDAREEVAALRAQLGAPGPAPAPAPDGNRA